MGANDHDIYYMLPVIQSGQGQQGFQEDRPRHPVLPTYETKHRPNSFMHVLRRAAYSKDIKQK